MITNKYNNTITFSVKFLGATNNKGSRVKISEIKRYQEQKNNSITLDYNYQIGDVLSQGLEYLEKKGAKIVGYSSTVNEYLIFCDNWSDEYLTLKK